MAGRWPFPGDSQLVRARKVALAYRAALGLAYPASCRAVDERMAAWGQTWAVPRPAGFEADDWIGPADAADLASVAVDTVGSWRRRGRLVGRQVDGNRWEYQVSAIHQVSALIRQRAGRDGGS